MAWNELKLRFLSRLADMTLAKGLAVSLLLAAVVTLGCAFVWRDQRAHEEVTDAKRECADALNEVRRMYFDCTAARERDNELLRAELRAQRELVESLLRGHGRPMAPGGGPGR